MTEQEAQAQLEEDVQWQAVPELTSTEMERLLLRARAVDAAGRKPGDSGYVTTYTVRSVRYATGTGWLWKAAKAVSLLDVSAGGVSVSGRTQIHGLCMRMAKKYGGGGVSTIGTLTTPTVLSNDSDIDLVEPGLRIDS